MEHGTAAQTKHKETSLRSLPRVPQYKIGRLNEGWKMS